MLSKDQAQDLIEEIALASEIDQDDLISIRQRIPSNNPYITALLEEVACVYFLTDEVLAYYCQKLYQLAQS